MSNEKHHFLKIIDQNIGIIRSLCKVYYEQSEDQDDAFQDVILQLWKSFDTFRGESEISTWIYRVCLNTILTKKRKDQKSVPIKSIELVNQDVYAINADDNVELLHLIIQSLKDIDKAIILLYLEGYRSKEIAEILKLSQTNVTTRFNRIKSQLAKKINHISHENKRS